MTRGDVSHEQEFIVFSNRIFCIVSFLFPLSYVQCSCEPELPWQHLWSTRHSLQCVHRAGPLKHARLLANLAHVQDEQYADTDSEEQLNDTPLKILHFLKMKMI